MCSISHFNCHGATWGHVKSEVWRCQTGKSVAQALDYVCPNDTDCRYAGVHTAGCSQGSAADPQSVTLNLPRKSWWDLSPPLFKILSTAALRASGEFGGGGRGGASLHINRLQIRQGLKSMETFARLWTLGHNPSAPELSYSSFLLFGEFICGRSHPLKLCLAVCYWGGPFQDTEMDLKA